LVENMVDVLLHYHMMPVLSQSRSPPYFMEPEGSSPLLQELANFSPPESTPNLYLSLIQSPVHTYSHPFFCSPVCLINLSAINLHNLQTLILPSLSLSSPPHLTFNPFINPSFQSPTHPSKAQDNFK